MSEPDRTMVMTEERQPIPIADVVTGRGFITGKSGSGKSNTASVLCEELLDEGIPLMIVDTDGEYYGLKEEYELLHVGGDERCDLRVGPQHAEKIAEITLGSNVPIILDVSGFIEESDSKRLVHDVVRELFIKEKKAKIPYLLLIEEAHEFIPESGGLDEVGDMLVRVAKRGRKRGLGVCAMSQRPASVSKDFITQCDWLVWHRLTWKNDTKVVSRIMGSQTAEEVKNLNPGEAILRADWWDDKLRVKFRRKRTLDAGATPDLDGLHEDGDAVRSDVVDELEDAGASLTKQGEEADWDEETAAEPADTASDQELEAAADAVDAPEPSPMPEEGTGAASPDAAETQPADAATDEESNDDDQAESQAAGDAASATPTEDPPESTEDALERAARNVTAGKPVQSPTKTGTDGASADGGIRTPTADPDPADDPVWEVAEFIAYLIASLGAITVRVGMAIERAVLGVAGAEGTTGSGDTSEVHKRPLIGLLVATLLIWIGVAIGIALIGVL
jgi:hypothetical protein